MFLAFKMSDLVTVPFGWLLGVLYDLTSNYGVAMILFALAVNAVLLPINAKSKKSMMKMSRIQPQMQEIQRRYALYMLHHRLLPTVRYSLTAQLQ